MPGIRQYPQAAELLPTDAFVIDRVGYGTMYIEAQDMGIGGSSTYDIAMWYPGVIPESATLFVFNAVENFYLPQNFTDSVFTIGQSSESGLVFTVFRNSSQVGTITFGPNQTTGVGASSEDIAFVPEMQLVVMSPEGNGGATNPAFTFKATLTGGVSA